MAIGAEWDGFASVPNEFIADEATVVALGEYSGTYKATGKNFRAPFANVWTFREGKGISFHQYIGTIKRAANSSFRSLTSGEVIDRGWTRFSFPPT